MSAQVTDRAASLWDVGARWDAILATLRAEGFTKVDCIKAARKLLRLPLADAKRVVHESPTWADVRERDDELQDRFMSWLEVNESNS